MKTENKTCEQLVDSQMQDRNEYLEGLNDIIGDNESDTEKVEEALLYPERINRYGSLCLGESRDLVNEVHLLTN